MANLVDVDVAVGERFLIEALDRAADVAPAAVDAARRELDDSLAATRRSALGELAWSASALTPSRFPVEIAVTSASPELRTTVEVVAPEDDKAAALGRAIELAEQFGAVGLVASHRLAMERHQRALVLRFGAWLSSRHNAGSTRHKLYAEVAADRSDAWALVDRLAPAARRVLGGVGPVRFLGMPLDGSAGIEVYVRPPTLDPFLLAAVLGRAGLRHGAERLNAAMSGTAEQSDRGFDGPNHGVSVSIGDDGNVVAVAAFTFAHHRWGRDHRVRRRILELATAEVWPSADLYARLSAPLAVATPLIRPYHVALSEVMSTARDAVEHHVSLAPMPSNPPPRTGDS